MRTLDHAPRHRWDERLGLPHGSVEQVVHGSESWRQAQCGLITTDAYWQDVAARLNLTPADLHRLQIDYFSGDVLDQNLVTYIRELRDHGHPVALLSNDSPELVAKLQRLEIDTLFDPLVISAQIGVMKPAPQAYQAVLDRLQLPASQTVFIDDMPANIVGAQEIGMHGILYHSDVNLRQALDSILNQR